MDQRILVTGGTGYIGSHVCVSLVQSGYKVIVLDNFHNSKPSIIANIEKITQKKFQVVIGDIRDKNLLEQIFSSHDIRTVIHLAGLKSVEESVAKPLEYFSVNVQGSINLFSTMKTFGVNTLVYSSSATVYGNTESLPFKESHPCTPCNTYGVTKKMVEEIIADIGKSDPSWRAVCLRYFNPIGAHKSGLIGEDPRDCMNNLAPAILSVLAKKNASLKVFGGDYPTVDGTAVRDYIHVVDLANGHLAALEYCKKQSGILNVNLGTGQGYTVLQVLKAFEKVSARKIPYTITTRRPGDLASYWADPSLAFCKLKWRAAYSLEEMCEDSLKWHRFKISFPRRSR